MTQSRTRWWALAAVSLANFMAYLDNNVTNVALPTIERNLHLSVSGLEWIVSSYVLALASLLLVGGRLADVFGRRRIFLIGLVAFTLASLASGLAGSGTVLITARAIQGIGAALMLPASLAILLHAFTEVRERTTALGLWGAVGALALALGPVIGGLISQHIHWGWIFLINVPVGAITLAIGILAIAKSHGGTEATARMRRLDIPGLLTSTLTLTALTYALIEGQSMGWTSAAIVAAFTVAAVSALSFLILEARTANPMVPLPIFRSRVFSGGIGTMMIWGFGILGIYFFTSLYLQGILGFSPTKAGLAFVPMALCIVVFSALAPRVVAVLSGHRAVALGMALMTGGLVLFARLGMGATFVSLMPGFVLFGAGAGLMNVPLTNSIMESAPSERSGIASALLNASREVAGLLGITVIGAILRAREAASLRGGATASRAFLDGYHTGLWVTVALLAAGVILSYVTLRPHSGAAAVSAEPSGGSLAGSSSDETAEIPGGTFRA
jgi:EmrB/QacA subfamily drug resistance transporter